MKYLMFFIMVLPTVSGATDYYISVNKTNAAYRLLEKCKAVESSDCLVPKKDMRHWKVGQVDNPKSIAYVKQDAAPCSDLESCQPLYEALDCSGYAEDSFAVMLMDYSEVYCAEPSGFNQMTGWVVDDAGSAAADAADAQKTADEGVRSSMKADRDTKLKQCVRVGLKGISDLDPGTATTSQLANRQNKLIACFVELMKEVVSPRLDPADL